MNSKDKQLLKAKAHKLKPVVMIGAKGLTENVMEEINQALLAHELIKVKVSGAEKDDKKQMISDITGTLDAQLIQQIGNICVIFRKNKD